MTPGGAAHFADRNWRLEQFWGFLLARDSLSERLQADVSGLHPAELFELGVRTWGLGSIDSLTGQFAAVLRHPTDDRRALVRDHLGLVPLYWGRQGRRVVAHADLEVVRDAVWDGASLEPDVIAAHLMPVNEWAGERTQLAGIHRVLPGTITLVDSRGRRSVRYFHPELETADITLDPAAAVDRMYRAVSDAVADACADAKISSHLSGGLDSGVVTAMAQRHLGRAGRQLVSTHSWTPTLRAGDTEAPEQRLLRLTEHHLGLTANRVSYSDSRDAGMLSLDPLLYPHWGYLEYEWAVLHQVRARGGEVILSGWGGDDFASGSTPLDPTTFIRGEMTGRLWDHLSALADKTGRSRSRLVAGVFRSAAERGPLRSLRDVRRRQEAQRRWPLWLRDHGHVVASSSLYGPAPCTAQDFMTARVTSMDLTWRTDTWWKAAKAHGLEYRYPLLDQRVVRTALRMPPWYFHGEGYRRWGFRQIAREFLPDVCALCEDKTEPVRVAELSASDLWLDRVARNEAASAQFGELTRLQLANQLARGSGSEALDRARADALDRIDAIHGTVTG